MEDDAPVIYGLEFQARALTPQTAETDAIRFLVGTQSLKYDNQIHIVDFDDENNIISKNVLLHQVGEIWHISTSPADKGVLATCYNKPSDSKVLTCAAVWRMPKELEPGGHESPDDSTSPAHTLELLCHLDNTAHGSMACPSCPPDSMRNGKPVADAVKARVCWCPFCINPCCRAPARMRVRSGAGEHLNVLLLYSFVDALLFSSPQCN